MECRENSRLLSTDNFYFTLPDFRKTLIDQLCVMRKDTLLTDITIQAEDRTFPCHKAVLAASSQYFKAMFSYGTVECQQNVIEMHDITKDTMGFILNYLYTGECNITRKNATDLLVASDLLQMDQLKSELARFLMNCVDENNCLQLKRLGQRHSCENLFQIAHNYAKINFCDVIKQEEFLDLDSDEIVSYLSDDELSVGKEDYVFDAVLNWINYDFMQRSHEISKALACVRLPFVTPQVLQDVRYKHPLLLQDPQAINLLSYARNFQKFGKFFGREVGKQRKPRVNASKKVLITFGGENSLGKSSANESKINLFDPKINKWETLAVVKDTLPNQAFNAVTLEYDIYITGGVKKNEAIGDVRVFYTYLNKWKQVCNLNNRRYHHGSVAINQHIYVVGGTDGKRCLDSVEIFFPTSDKWVESEPLVHAVKCPAVAAFNSKIYVLGGFTESYAICSAIQIFDTATSKWSAIVSHEIDYTCAQAVVLRDKIYLFGGCSRSVKIYDPHTDEITHAAEMTTKRDNCGAAVMDGEIFVTGGIAGSKGPVMNTAEKYSPTNDKWTEISDLPEPLYRHGCVCIRIPIYRKEGGKNT